MFHLKVQISLFVPSTHVYTCSDIFVLCILQCLPEFYNYVGSQIPLLFSSIGCHLRDLTFSDFLQSTEIFFLNTYIFVCRGIWQEVGEKWYWATNSRPGQTCFLNISVFVNSSTWGKNHGRCFIKLREGERSWMTPHQVQILLFLSTDKCLSIFPSKIYCSVTQLSC